MSEETDIKATFAAALAPVLPPGALTEDSPAASAIVLARNEEHNKMIAAKENRKQTLFKLRDAEREHRIAEQAVADLEKTVAECEAAFSQVTGQTMRKPEYYGLKTW